MVSEELVNELAIVYYISKDFPSNGNYTNQDFEVLHQKKQQWKVLPEEERNLIRSETMLWIEAYKEKFPEQFAIVENTWKKINW